MKRIKIIQFIVFIFIFFNLFSIKNDLSHSYINPNGWRLPKEKYLKLISTNIKEIAGINIKEEIYDYTGGYFYFIMNNRIVNGKVDLKEWEREWPNSVTLFRRNDDNKILLYWISSTPEMLPLHKGLIEEQERREAGIIGGITGDLAISFYLDLDNDGKYEALFVDPGLTDEKEREQYIEDLIKLKINPKKN